MKSGILSTLLVLIVAALSNVVDANESVALLRQLRALGFDSGGSSWGGDNGRDHPGVRNQKEIYKGILSCYWYCFVAMC